MPKKLIDNFQPDTDPSALSIPRSSTQTKQDSSKSSNLLFQRLLQGTVVEKTKISQKSELNIFLAEPRQNTVSDILPWWNTNQNRFPILS